MALGILGAFGGLNKKEIADCVFVGELSLDGGLRGVRGALPIAVEARSRKIPKLVVPEINAREAAMVGGVAVYPVRSLLDVIHFINSGNSIEPVMVDRAAILNTAQTSTQRKPPRWTSRMYEDNTLQNGHWKWLAPVDITF